jgi:hypothetical protein
VNGGNSADGWALLLKGGLSVKRIVIAILLGGSLTFVAGRRILAQEGNALLYADFETMTDGRPVSARGGFVQIIAFQESDVRKSTFKGLEGATPPAPELVHIKKDDPTRAMKFEFALQAPNQWAGVGVEIHGLPDKDGKPVPDDVSGYKNLSMQVYATGVPILRIEAMSRGQGMDLSNGHPLMTFKVREGFNTYKVPLKGFSQPSWVDTRIDPKDLFKKLTAINISAFCDQCTPMQGMVIIDNVAFEK